MPLAQSATKLRSLVFAVLLLALPLGFLAPTSAQTGSPPAPRQLAPTGDCPRDNIFYGAVPPGGADSRVLLFVHGLGGVARDWWTDHAGVKESDGVTPIVNDMYDRAYQAGYRSAFVNLSYEPNCAEVSWPGNTWQVNGGILSQQITAVAAHYGVDKIDIVAHSKGGIETQAAIIRHGAWPKVRSVFFMGSPHQGSIVADFACSPGVRDSFPGLATDAACSIQTNIVQPFRAEADASPLDDAIRYYSGAGNACHAETNPAPRCEGFGSWMSTHPDGGPNDNAVTVASTAFPGSTTLFAEPLSHTELIIGKYTFRYIDQALDDEGTKRIFLPTIAVAAAPAGVSAPGQSGR